jgi:hypothetical protein
MPKSRTYFAAANRREIGKTLATRLKDISTHEQRHNVNEYKSAYKAYYGKENGYGITFGVTRGGQRGQLANLRVNRARALLNAWVSLVTAPKISWKPEARTDDSGTLAASTKAIQLFEDLWKTRGLGTHDRRIIEAAGAFSYCVTFPEWDMNAGPPGMPLPDGRLLRNGDITLRLILPWDVRVEPDRKSWDELDSFFVCVQKNRFDVAALASTYGLADGRTGKEAEDHIVSCTGDKVLVSEINPTNRTAGEGAADLVPVWYFFHKPTASLPYGREVQFIDEATVLVDRTLGTYDGEVPLIRMAAADMFDTPNAWSSWWDTLGPQELLDGVDTMLGTTATSLGSPCIAYEAGTQPKPDKIGPFRTWPYPKGGKPPTAVVLAEFPKEALAHKADLKDDQRMLMGLNDIALGQPQTAQMNAQAFVVLASMAQQQASPVQTSRNEAWSRIGSVWLKAIKKNVKDKRPISIESSATEKLYQKVSYRGDDFAPLDGVRASIGNPMEQMPGGRLALLESLQQGGTPLTVEQKLQVIETGRLEPAIRGVRDELQHLNYERDELLGGRSPPALPLDNNSMHYRENGAVMFSAAARRDPAVIKAVDAHLKEHYLNEYGVERDMDPMRHQREAFLLGRPPNPLAQMAPPGPPGGPTPPGAGPGVPPGEPPPAQAGLATQVLSPDNPVNGAGPAPTKNPMTGMPFDPAGGAQIQ